MDSHKIVWNPSFTVGDELIDGEHRVLIELVAQIPDHPSEQDEALLNTALEYAASHFKNEEAYMKAVDYPELEAHTRYHKKLTKILNRYRSRYEAGETDLFFFKQFMFTWIRDHIMDEDPLIAAHVESLDVP